MVNIDSNTNIREIRSVASRQANKKGGKLALINHPKLSQSDPNPSSPNITEPITEDELMIKTLVKIQLRDAVQEFKNPHWKPPS